MFILCAAFLGLWSWLLFGKMPMGDASISWVDGWMIRTGAVPYKTVYLYTMPFTAYVAAALHTLPASIIGMWLVLVFNAGVNLILLYQLVRWLKLHGWGRALVGIVFLAWSLVQLTSFTHHAFNLTVTTAVVVMLVGYAVRKQNSCLYVGAGLAALNFFITPHIGLATIGLVFSVPAGEWLFKRQREFAVRLGWAVFSGVTVFAALLGALALLAVPFKPMFATIGTGISQYTNHYPSLIAQNVELVSKAYDRLWPHAMKSAGDSVSAVAGPVAHYYFTSNLFTALFLGKSGLVYSLASLYLFCLLLLLFVYSGIVAIKRALPVRRTEFPILEWLLWANLAIIFLAGISAFQFGFAVVPVVIALAVSVVTQQSGRVKKIGVLMGVGLAVTSFLLLTTNTAVAWREHASRRWMAVADTNTAWVGSFYYGPDFVRSAESARTVINGLLKPGEQMIAYPRASELYYLFDRMPAVPTSMVAFSHPDSVYETVAEKARTESRILVWYTSPFDFSGNEETARAHSFIDPVLKANYILVYQDTFFQIYERT